LAKRARARRPLIRESFGGQLNGAGMWEFTHDEVIDAPPEVVFGVIADLPSYEQWNPFLVAASGRVEVGAVVSGKSVLGKIATSYRHRVYEYVPDRRLSWRDFGLSAFLVCGDRSRHVDPRDGATQYRCHLKLSGPLSGVIDLIFGSGLRNGVVVEARALKREAERRTQIQNRQAPS
jgi:hypothetical protein